MEIRRVQKTGGASYVITLPKDWINSHHINKNDPIGMIVQSDGTLLITNQLTNESDDRTKTFTINEDIDTKHLFRKLIASYISGYDTTIITSKTRIQPQVRTTIRKFTQTTIGQEVVEETDNTITIKDLLDPSEMPFDRTIKRMHIIIKNMHEDIMRAMETNDRILTEEVIKRDSDVDRLHWLIARQANILIRNASLAEKMHVTIDNTFSYQLISKILERIGDHIAKIAENYLKIDENNIKEDIIESIRTTSEYAMQLFTKSVMSFLRRDLRSANKNVDDVKKLIKKCQDLNEYALHEKGVTAVSIGYMLESIKRIGEYSGDISENAINFVVSCDAPIK